jgi:hypothetical protein
MGLDAGAVSAGVVSAFPFHCNCRSIWYNPGSFERLREALPWTYLISGH